MVSPQEKYILCLIAIYPNLDKKNLEKTLLDLKNKNHSMPIYKFGINEDGELVSSNVGTYLKGLADKKLTRINRVTEGIEPTEEGWEVIEAGAKISVKTAIYLWQKNVTRLRR